MGLFLQLNSGFYHFSAPISGHHGRFSIFACLLYTSFLWIWIYFGLILLQCSINLVSSLLVSIFFHLLGLFFFTYFCGSTILSLSLIHIWFFTDSVCVITCHTIKLECVCVLKDCILWLASNKLKCLSQKPRNIERCLWNQRQHSNEGYADSACWNVSIVMTEIEYQEWCVICKLTCVAIIFKYSSVES